MTLKLSRANYRMTFSQTFRKKGRMVRIDNYTVEGLMCPLERESQKVKLILQAKAIMIEAAVIMMIIWSRIKLREI